MFWTRLASGVVLLAVAVGALGCGGVLLALILWAVSLAGFRELTKALKCAAGEMKINVLEIIGFAGITAYYLLMYFTEGHTYLLMCIVATFLAVLFAYVMTFPRYDAARVMAAVFAFLSWIGAKKSSIIFQLFCPKY